MPPQERVLIAGAGPIGLVAASSLIRAGIPVTVLEAGSDLAVESRASTFHPPTLDMLDEFGAAAPLIAQGLVAPKLQFRTRRDGRIAQFDFAGIADVTRHPFRLQSEQWKLTRILHDLLAGNPLYEIEFGSAVTGVTQDADGVTATVERDGVSLTRHGSWLIGADGARSAVRRSLGIEFEGFTWPERFLVVSTPFDFLAEIPDLDWVSYVSDPEQWYFFLRIPGLWRMMFPIAPEITDETATSNDFVQARMARVIPGRSGYEVAHITLYRVHQRVAKSYRSGRVLLAGDAAHVNNPLGGMGMNGGVHDAVNLAERLARVWHGEAPGEELDRYDRQRRLIATEFVQKQSIQNKANLEAKDPAEIAAFKERMRLTSEDPKLAYQYLLNASMISSLRRAAELG